MRETGVLAKKEEKPRSYLCSFESFFISSEEKKKTFVEVLLLLPNQQR